MLCISCQSDINPKWRHAIDINVCPYCGNSILEEHLKNLLTSLAQVMNQLQQYPDQVSDWLLSNYDYIKTNSTNLKNYLPKEAVKELQRELNEQEFQEKKQSIVTIKTPDGGTQEVIVEKTQSDEKTNSFFERAEVIKGSGKTSGKGQVATSFAPKSVAEKTQHLKERVQQIKRIAAGGEDDVVLEEAEPLEGIDSEEAIQLQSIIDSGDIVSSGLPEPIMGDDDEIPSVVLNMARGANKGGGNADKDLQALQKMQSRSKGAANRMGSGNGSFSRG